VVWENATETLNIKLYNNTRSYERYSLLRLLKPTTTWRFSRSKSARLSPTSCRFPAPRRRALYPGAVCSPAPRSRASLWRLLPVFTQDARARERVIERRDVHVYTRVSLSTMWAREKRTKREREQEIERRRRHPKPNQNKTHVHFKPPREHPQQLHANAQPNQSRHRTVLHRRRKIHRRARFLVVHDDIFRRHHR